MEQTYLEAIEALHSAIETNHCMPSAVKTEAIETLASLRDILWDYSA